MSEQSDLRKIVEELRRIEVDYCRDPVVHRDRLKKALLGSSPMLLAAAERCERLEAALRDLISACKTSGRMVGYNSDVVDRAEAALAAKE